MELPDLSKTFLIVRLKKKKKFYVSKLVENFLPDAICDFFIFIYFFYFLFFSLHFWHLWIIHVATSSFDVESSWSWTKAFTVAVWSSPIVNLSKHTFFHSVGPYSRVCFMICVKKIGKKKLRPKKNGSRTFAKSNAHVKTNARASFET